VSSVTWAGLILNGNNTYCFEATDISIASSHAGIISNFNGVGFSLQRVILAENQYASKIWYGNDADENRLTFTNLVISAMARPNCPYCYSIAGACQNLVAILIPIVQIHGKSIPIDKVNPDGLLSQCIDAAFDSKLILTNVTFMNYKLDYSKDNNSNYASYCQNNFLFQQPDIPDAASRIFMTGVTNVNGDPSAIIVEQEPNINFLGWRGGCGDFNCTGNKNYLVTDLDGSFFGYKGQILPQNLGINSPACTSTQNTWDAQMCTGINFGIMEFQNDGPDQRQRLISPLNVSSQYMYSTLNEWREWQWLGPDPLNMRLARFNGIVETNKSLWLQYTVTVPEQLKFKLETYVQPWWVIISMWYERPNVIEVWNMFNNTFISPFRPDQKIDLTTMVDQCGANIYNSNNCTITFVLNSQPGCVLKVRTINAIKITMHLTNTVEDFYSNDGQTTFIDKISTFLGLDMGRIRIAGISSGSTIVDFAIVENLTLQNSTSPDDSLASNASTTPNSSQIQNFNAMASELTNYGNQLTQAVNNGSLVMPSKLGNVTGITTQLVVTNITATNTTNNTNNTNNTNGTTNHSTKTNDNSNLTVILIATLIPSFVLIILIIICCIKNKDGFSLIKMAYDYTRKNKKIETSFNQELMKKNVMDIFHKIF